MEHQKVHKANEKKKKKSIKRNKQHNPELDVLDKYK
jgi:hypothetical protein